MYLCIKKRMNKTINKIKNFCHGPIASNVIAGLIVPFVIFLGKRLYSFIIPLYAQHSLSSLVDFTTKTINIDVSLLSFSLITLICVLFLILLLTYAFKTFYKTLVYALPNLFLALAVFVGLKIPF